MHKNTVDFGILHKFKEIKKTVLIFIVQTVSKLELLYPGVSRWHIIVELSYFLKKKDFYYYKPSQ